MNTYQMFTTMRDHLLTMAQSNRLAGICLYRGPDGYRCAVGRLIDDKYYSENIERKGVAQEPVIEAVSASVGRALTAFEIKMMADIQRIHDAFGAPDWAQELERYERAFFGEQYNARKQKAAAQATITSLALSMEPPYPSSLVLEAAAELPVPALSNWINA